MRHRGETSTQTAGPRIYGQTFQGLDAASPLGTDVSNRCVADFIGATAQTRGSFSDDGTQPGITPWTHQQSQTLGSSFVCQRNGRWLVKATVFYVGEAGASTLTASLTADATAAQLTGGAVLLGATSIDSARCGHPAGSTATLKVQGIVERNSSESPVVRLLLDNGAGAGGDPALIDEARTFISFEYLGPCE